MEVTRQRKLATPVEWAANKQIIIELYAEQELDEVMQAMERDHGFFSTYVTPFPLPIFPPVHPALRPLN